MIYRRFGRVVPCADGEYLVEEEELPIEDAPEAIPNVLCGQGSVA